MKANGTISHITLLRPLEWIEQEQAVVAGQVYIRVPECGIDGNARIHDIESCPEIASGGGQVVTGTFRHQSDAGLELQIAGESEAIRCTGNHPFWSADHQDFVRADHLRIGETLRTASGQTQVQSVETIPGQHVVYNIEVFGNHVYHVGTTGVLVHNGGPCDPEALFNEALKTQEFDTVRVSVEPGHVRVTTRTDANEITTHLRLEGRPRGEGALLNGKKAIVDTTIERGKVLQKQLEKGAAAKAQEVQTTMIGLKSKYHHIKNSCVTHVHDILKAAGINADALFGLHGNMNKLKEILKRLGFLEE